MNCVKISWELAYL